jgi:catechol 2,3-dioxygenase-like lactoylglutathione lyase family enzyme
MMDWKLEVVKVPVADLDRARTFYSEQLGFPVDYEVMIGEDRQFLQVTPPGSGCSIVLGTGLTEMTPGSLESPQLVVPDIRAARAHLVENGVDASEVQVASRDGSLRLAEDHETGTALDNVGIVFFSDPDGNRWAVQQISGRS